ncbi:MAG: HD domain-containing protein [bacterium]|nr:HD domain-containing protein [bacterium]
MTRPVPIRSDLPLPRDELKGFFQELSQFTGLGISYFPAGSDQPYLIAGESTFCMQLKSTPEGARRCQASTGQILARCRADAGPEFDICHARMAEMAVPLRSAEGLDLGTVFVGHALIQGMSEEHKEHVRTLAGELGFASADRLIMEASRSPVYTRSRLEALGRFIREQLVEKARDRGAIEDTTEYLLQKYEELMFLYAVTESLAPDSGHKRALTVILDKGAQKVGAKWGTFLLADTEGLGTLEVLETYGELPWSGDGQAGSGLEEVCLPCSGPALVSAPLAEGGEENLLIVPFRLRNFREGYVVFGLAKKGAIGDGDLRFALALSRQASSVLYAVHLYQELADLLFATLGALSSAIDAKDPYTHGHSQRVAEFAVMAAGHMGYNSKFLTMLKIAGQLHDFGKIGVREYILGKEGRLDDEEKLAMNEHPVIGAHILGKFKSFAEIVPGIRHHHERYDGGGYPEGLRGEEIPLVGRIIAVADAYDAMTTTRPYRARLQHKDALVELRRFAGIQFDPAVVEAFIAALGGPRGTPETPGGIRAENATLL